MIEIHSCPVCGAAEWQFIFTVPDHSISKEEFRIKKCTACSFMVTSPRPDEDKLGQYYKSENYISHSGKGNSVVNLLYLQARKYSLNWKLNLIKQLKPEGSLLDVGCGTGEFLSTIKANGFSVDGVELDESARARASQLIGQPITPSLKEANGSYDLITLWHVLEHLPELNESIEKINSLLKTDGKLLIAVPNHTSNDAQHYQQHWAGYDVPRHLWHFNKTSMATLLHGHGFAIEKIIPMKLDAFYVSMLSEKYLGNAGISSLIKGFVSGVRSNMKAKATGECSSLIYIARK